MFAGEKRAVNAEKIHWNKIISKLEKWREQIAVNQGVTDPSVTTVAENYRQSPWAVLVSTIISLRTKDEVTLVASERLLKKADTPEKLNIMKAAEVEKLIYPAGFYRNKTASLKAIAAILIEQYKGNVPSTMEELLALPGVGRKTANLVLTEAFDLDGLCVDIHVHRISNRNGWLDSKNPDETEMILRKILPKKYWKRINYLLVLYGQRVCRPTSPFCSRCVINRHCKQNGVGRYR